MRRVWGHGYIIEDWVKAQGSWLAAVSRNFRKIVNQKKKRATQPAARFKERRSNGCFSHSCRYHECIYKCEINEERDTNEGDPLAGSYEATNQHKQHRWQQKIACISVVFLRLSHPASSLRSVTHFLARLTLVPLNKANAARVVATPCHTLTHTHIHMRRSRSFIYTPPPTTTFEHLLSGWLLATVVKDCLLHSTSVFFPHTSRSPLLPVTKAQGDALFSSLVFSSSKSSNENQGPQNILARTHSYVHIHLVAFLFITDHLQSSKWAFSFVAGHLVLIHSRRIRKQTMHNIVW